VKLTKLGANVILACRNADRTAAALAQCRASRPNAQAEFIRLDLQSFASVREFVATFQSKYKKLDILINNAGN
jgi:retinol dehydrogenase-12